MYSRKTQLLAGGKQLGRNSLHTEELQGKDLAYTDLQKAGSTRGSGF